MSLVSFVVKPVAAQTASVTGTVVDQTGGTLPGATVQLTGTTNAVTTSGSGGQYTFRNVAPGTYVIEVRLIGFAPAIRENVTVGSGDLTVPAITLEIATLSDLVVVTATRSDTALIDVPVTMSVLSSDTIAASPAQNYGDLLRSVPGVNVIQTSARDVNLTSRQGTSTLSNSQLVLVDGRSVYLDFFGIVLWDFLPTNLSDVKQIEVIRGPASAVWGANAVTGVVNIVTKSPREAPGTTASISVGGLGRDAGSSAGKGPGGLFGSNVSVSRIANDRWSYRLSAGYFTSDAFARPSGVIPLITDPRDPAATVGGATYPDDGDGPLGTAFANSGSSQPRFDARVDQELERGRVSYSGGIAGSNGIIHTGIGPFDIQKGSHNGYGRVGYNNGALKLNFFASYINADAPNLLLAGPHGHPAPAQFLDADVRLRGRRRLSAGAAQRVERRRQRPAQQLRHHDRSDLREPDRARRVRPGRDSPGSVPLHAWRPGGQVREPRGSGLFSAARGDVQAGSGPCRARLVQPRVQVAVGHQQLPRHQHRRSHGPERACAASAAAAQRRWWRAPFPLTVRAVGSRLPIGTIAQDELVEESLTAYEIAYNGDRSAAPRSARRFTSTIWTTRSTSRSFRRIWIPIRRPIRRRDGRFRRQS